MDIRGPYVYSPYLWPITAATIFLVGLGLAGWRQRTKPGAVPFALAAAASALWMIGVALELAAVSTDSKIFWVKFQALWMLPAVTAILYFSLEFENIARRPPRRLAILLSLPILLMALAVATDHRHHLFWRSITYDQNVHTSHALVGWLFIAYAYGVGIWTLFVLIRLFIRSPHLRRPVALVLCGIFLTRTAFLLDVAEFNIIAPLDLLVPSIVLSSTLYGLALFRFDLFNPISLARDKVIAQMREGMVVLDPSGSVIEMNREAEQLVGLPAAEMRGQPLRSVLPTAGGLPLAFNSLDPQHVEIGFGGPQMERTLALSLSPIAAPRGECLGHLLLFHDVTEEKLIRARVLEQERALATMQERDRLARELHDSAGQVLGYVSLQAQAIRKLVHDGNLGAAEAQLGRLAQQASAAHLDIRESILGLKAGSTVSGAFLTSLRQYVEQYGEHYGMIIHLQTAGDLIDENFAPDASSQLLRVIGEAITNARKHSRAGCVRIGLAREGGEARIDITDDGQGFDLARLDAGGGHFGLTFMRERIEQVGGRLEIHSQPGAGTCVSLNIPLHNTEGKAA